MSQAEQLTEIFSCIEAVQINEELDMMVVWSGGVNYHVYNTESLKMLHEFELSTNGGKPVSEEKAVTKMKEHLEDEQAALEAEFA